jgi:hypothetical protein
MPTAPPEINLPPYIRRSSIHYDYARLALQGITNRDACAMLGISTRQGRRWRDTLCRRARAYFGLPLKYATVAAWCVKHCDEGAIALPTISAFPGPDPRI